MNYICLLTPAFISLYLKYKNEKNLKSKIINIICYYFIMVNIINLSIAIIAKVFFGNYSYVFTTSFCIKYLIIADILALIYHLVEIKIKNILNAKKENIHHILEKIIEKYNLYKSNVLKIIIFMFFNILFFLSIDIYLRTISHNITNYYYVSAIYPNLFTGLYAILIGIIIMLFSKRISRILLLVTYIFNIILFLANYMLLQIKSQAFSIYDLGNANEGFKYLNFLFKEINLKLVIFILFLIFIIIINYVLLKKIHKPKISIRIIVVIVTIILFLIFKAIVIFSLTNYEKDGSWAELNYPGYYYDNYINNNRSLLVLGLYEYTSRDIYLYFKNLNETYGSLEEIEEIISTSELEYKENDYTGIFEGKNLIMIQMESIDNLVINEDIMPTLTYMQENGWNFTGRYTNNITTFYTEFAVLTGLYYLDAEYVINNNSYFNSLPNTFFNKGYITNSVHENYGKYYNREVMHQKFGFENRYFLYDILETTYLYDPQIVEIEEIYQGITSATNPFLSYIITISAHGPYNNNDRCTYDLEEYDELTCLNYLSSLTDKMLEELLNSLEEDGLLEDTVIVLFSDHYPYAYSFTDEDLADLEQIDETYQIRNIPFIIYAEGIESSEISTLFNDVDVLPTILNLFGIEYEPSEYVGVDIFSPDHKDLIFLSDYTWYDGNIYSGNYTGEITNEYIANTEYMTNRLEFNKMIISNNYYS